MPKFKLFFGGIIALVAGANGFFGWFRQFDWLHKNSPGVWRLLVTPELQLALIFTAVGLCSIGLWEIWQFKYKLRPKASPSEPPQDSFTGINVTGDRNTFGDTTIITGASKNTLPVRLTLSFDPNDKACIQNESPLPKGVLPHDLYRVRVDNGNGLTAHNVKVILENVPTSLSKYQGVCLQVRHHPKEATSDIGIDSKEYFDFLVYNSCGEPTGKPVLFITHVTQTLDWSVPVSDYEFTLRAYCEETKSNEVTLRFIKKENRHCVLEQMDGPTIRREAFST